MNKKANTIENFILRHGLEKGKLKWDEYIEKLKHRPTPKNPHSKKDWKPMDIIKHYDSQGTINHENIPDYFLVKFQEKWNELKFEYPKYDSTQLYSKTIKFLFSAKSQIKKEYWLQRFWCDYDAEEKAKSKRVIQVANESWYIKKYGFEKGKQLWIDKCNASNLLENWTKKFGIKQATEMYEAYRTKLSVSHSLDGYIEKYGVELGTNMRNEWLSKQGRSREYYINLYGEKEGQEKYKKIIDAQKYYSTLDGMIERYGEIDGTKRYNKWYASTKKGKDYFIKRYGVENGLIYWTDLNSRRVESWKKNASLEGFQRKYGNELGTEKWFSWKSFSGNYSQKSFNLFSMIVDSYPEFKDSHFGEYEKVIDLQDADISKDFAKPDFLWNNKIIEFNGVYWHRDPRFFDDSIENQNIRRRDYDRLQSLEQKGYSVKVIWETDYDNNPFDVLDECVKFLKNNVK